MNNTKLKIAFSGPSGLGKTTLCKYVEENVNIPHLSTSAMDILSDYDKRTLKNSFRYKGTGHKEVINLSSKDPSFGSFFRMQFWVLELARFVMPISLYLIGVLLITLLTC